uniref:Uncharacterized protein n=1 Tax=Arundo donax TaxID=35708 RepID=A0A0A8YFR8_ARUDO
MSCNGIITFNCLENTLEWKHRCHWEMYIRPWCKKDLSRAQE